MDKIKSDLPYLTFGILVLEMVINNFYIHSIFIVIEEKNKQTNIFLTYKINFKKPFRGFFLNLPKSTEVSIRYTDPCS